MKLNSSFLHSPFFFLLNFLKMTENGLNTKFFITHIVKLRKLGERKRT